MIDQRDADMPSLLFCGPKMAACGIVISIWGVIMLVRSRRDRLFPGRLRNCQWGLCIWIKYNVIMSNFLLLILFEVGKTLNAFQR